MNLKEQSKQDNIIMRLLKLSELRRPIAWTNKGELSIRLPYKGTEVDYKFILDAVPVSDEENKKLINILYSGKSN